MPNLFRVAYYNLTYKYLVKWKRFFPQLKSQFYHKPHRVTRNFGSIKRTHISYKLVTVLGFISMEQCLFCIRVTAQEQGSLSPIHTDQGLWPSAIIAMPIC